MATLSSPDTFTLDNVRLFRCVTVENEKPRKTILYDGPLTIFIQDGTDDDDENNEDVLVLQCGNVLTLPVAGQHFERFEDGLFMCPADNGDDDEAASKLPDFVTFGFKLSVDSDTDKEGQSTQAAKDFQQLLVEHALFTDRRKCYAAKKVEQGTAYTTSKISHGAALFGKGLSSGSNFLKSKMNKSEKDINLTKTSSAISSVKKLSGKAANATQVITSIVIKKSIEAGTFVGDKIEHIGYVERLKKRRRAAALKNKGKPLSKIGKLTKGATEVALAFTKGGLGVFVALNDAADVILDDSIHAVGDVVEHKYGEQAGKLTEETFRIGVDGYKMYNMGKQGSKKLAKGIATDAALEGTGALLKEVLDDDNEGKK
jgi:hypothetical protein